MKKITDQKTIEIRHLVSEASTHAARDATQQAGVGFGFWTPRASLEYEVERFLAFRTPDYQAVRSGISREIFSNV
jgi:hypothetical protein